MYKVIDCSNIDKDMAQVIIIDSDEGDVDESLQYSVTMEPADHAILPGGV